MAADDSPSVPDSGPGADAGRPPIEAHHSGSGGGKQDSLKSIVGLNTIFSAHELPTTGLPSRRENGSIATTTSPTTPRKPLAGAAAGDDDGAVGAGAAAAAAAAGRRTGLLTRAIGTLALVGLVVALVGLGAKAAAAPSKLVPAAGPDRFPGWLSGPLHGILTGNPGGGYEGLLLGICACYAVVLASARALGPRTLWAGILAAHLAVLLGPPLLSADVFGYLDFARLGVLHSLDPYTHTAAAATGDAIYPYLGWHDVSTPYGPLFTLLTYGLVPLGIAGGIWALKVLAVVTSLATIALVWRSAGRRGLARGPAIVLLGLNPLLLVFAVGGAHNDTLLGLLVAAGLVAVLDRRDVAGAATLVGAIAIKASAGLALPFALIAAHRRDRGRQAVLAVLVALGAIVLIALVGFGGEISGITGSLRGQQQLVAIHSVPSFVSRLLGLGRLDATIRTGFEVAFVSALIGCLVHAWRHSERWLEAYGWTAVALLCATAWLLPWYALWALLPASLSADRRLRAAVLAICAYLVATRLPLAYPVLG
jgi:alpha-1,6-mannosyltransferase